MDSLGLAYNTMIGTTTLVKVSYSTFFFKVEQLSGSRLLKINVGQSRFPARSDRWVVSEV